MAHLLDRHLIQRANEILLLGVLWTGLAACVLGALAYDVALWSVANGLIRIRRLGRVNH
jgi:hypothetical protein